MSDFSHTPVMPEEVIAGLDIKPDGIYIDGTAGGGGHSSLIASRLSEKGRLVAIDRDPEAVAAAGERLRRFGPRAVCVRGNFADMKEICSGLGITAADGFLLDLGVSSYQLDNPERGFSYMHDAPLSMKMDGASGDGPDACDIVNGYGVSELRRILSDWGEEKYAGRIAEAICRARETKPVETTFELRDIITGALPDGGRSQKHHPAMRTFQAIRIEVNGEIALIPGALRGAVSLLRPGGRGCVITFHSVEDRAVKETFAALSSGCICPRDFPVCVCGRRPVIKLVGRKPVLPSPEEIRTNSRSHSAKLRTVEKLDDTASFTPGVSP